MEVKTHSYISYVRTPLLSSALTDTFVSTALQLYYSDFKMPFQLHCGASTFMLRTVALWIPHPIKPPLRSFKTFHLSCTSTCRFLLSWTTTILLHPSSTQWAIQASLQNTTERIHSLKLLSFHHHEIKMQIRGRLQLRPTHGKYPRNLFLSPTMEPFRTPHTKRIALPLWIVIYNLTLHNKYSFQVHPYGPCRNQTTIIHLHQTCKPSTIQLLEWHLRLFLLMTIHL